MSLRPNQVFNLIVVSIALALLAEGALLWKLSAREPRSVADSPRLPTPNATPNAAPSATFTPAPRFVAPPAFAPGGVQSAVQNGGSPLFSAPRTAPDSRAISRNSPNPGARLSNENRARAKTYFEAATQALKSKKPEVALENFRRVVQIAPDHLPTRLNLALLYLQANRPADAVPHLKKAALLDPKSPAPRFQLAQAYLSLRQPQLAIAPLQETLRLAPDERAARALLAQVYGAQKRPKDAYRQWSALAQSEPRDIEAHLQAANLAAGALKAPREAEKWLRRAQSASPKDPRAPLLLGQILISEKQPQNAAKVLAAASKARPEIFEIYPALAEARLAARDLSGARRALQSALSRLPKGTTGEQKGRLERAEGELRLSLGRVLGQSKQPAAARREFERAANLLPREAEPRGLLALAALQTGDAKAAQNALRSALALDPNRVGDRLTLAQLLAQRGDFGAAQTQFALYAQAQPRDLNALNQWALVMLNLKKPEKALPILAKIAALDPKNPAALLQSGAIARDAGRSIPALSLFERALSRRPNDAGALFEVARLQSTLKRPGAALTWQKFIAARPEFAPAYASLLTASARNGDEASARLFLARQLARGKENPRALSEILKFYAKTGRNSQARALLADIIQRNPRAQFARAALDSFAPKTASTATGASPTTASPTTAP